MNLVCFWFVQIPVAYLLAETFRFGSAGVFVAQALAFSLVAVIGIIIFRRGKWKLVKV
jgi:Na+-driven multidrug efflux pump